MSRLLSRLPRARLTPTPALRHLHASAAPSAVLLPITAHGPPPSPPLPAGEITDLRRRQKAEHTQDQSSGKGRFWKAVHVNPTPDGFSIHLDTRPLKTPLKHPLLIPRTKPLLATAIALEWSLLRTSADAAKGYLIPLTQLASRAQDLTAEQHGEMVAGMLRYLDTDTLLCMAPETQSRLRGMQEEALDAVLRGLTLWPGARWVRSEGVLPARQDVVTRGRVENWMKGLGPWELVGLERGVVAGKSLVVGARLVQEWMHGGGRGKGEGGRFGVEEAARAVSVEVRYQTGRWGVVEDSHDVEREDLRRQLGMCVLMVEEEG